MDPKNIPYYMISQPALSGYVEPALGRGFLTFYADVSDPLGAGTVQLALTVAAPPQICRSEPLALLGLAPGGEAGPGHFQHSAGPVSGFWPWHDTGWQPFAWDLLPPAAERQYPVIRLSPRAIDSPQGEGAPRGQARRTQTSGFGAPYHARRL